MMSDSAVTSWPAVEIPAQVGRFGRPEWVVVLLALAVRWAYIVGIRRHAAVLGDASFYFHQGKALARGQGFIVPFAWELEHRVVQAADHPPIFPLFLAALNKVGITTPLGQMLVNGAVGSLTVLLVMMLTRTLAGRRTALAAGGLAAIAPDMFSYDGFLLSETWAMLLLVASTLVLVRFVRDRRWPWAVACGLSIGAVSLVRAEFLMAGPMLACYLLVRGVRSQTVGRTIGQVAVVGVAALTVIAPWLLHNRSRFDAPVGMTVGLQFTLAVSNCDAVYFGPHAGYWDMTCILPAQQRTSSAGGDESMMANEAFNDGAAYIRAHLRRAFEMPALRVGRVLGLYRPLQQANLDVVPEGREHFVAFGALASWYLYSALGIVGARVLHQRAVPLFPLLLPGAVVIISVAITFGSVRYRAGFEPFVCILAAVGFSHIASGFRRIMETPTDR
jgi:4-amino-4-deoxy-L-arabinose transferase-like glycosyltransferase